MVCVLWAAAAAHRTHTTPDSGAIGARKWKIKKPCGTVVILDIVEQNML
ncbi:hypothetical protein KDA_73090 [Dictyobacter alpinus]|uniref:Uncharacterized protein n=1 Tax=Dictyobacter alpinus TaxID=2014873 RepID=A0A402BKE8_9CHLR|nr:hypothetical protein KDA_73090 [Dictyobacter alpinus]